MFLNIFCSIKNISHDFYEKKNFEVKSYLINLQESICESLNKKDSKGYFHRDTWERDEGGGGVSCIFQNGDVFESLGVNFSHVYINSLPPSATDKRPELSGRSFHAMGISLVAHPKNPHAPTTHFNLRYFVAETTDTPYNQANKKEKAPIWWFGGGFDMTPYYPYLEDAVHFHKIAKEACDPFGAHLYPHFKSAADNYFFLKHRNETRGIGGIFFDDFNEGGFENSFGYIQSIGNHFLKAYEPILEKRKHTPYGEKERQFQLYRRGRYVEFNLIYDRGTLFGLQSSGRTESILMSLPPLVRWEYAYRPEPNTREEALYTFFLKPQNWLTLETEKSHSLLYK